MKKIMLIFALIALVIPSFAGGDPRPEWLPKQYSIVPSDDGLRVYDSEKCRYGTIVTVEFSYDAQKSEFSALISGKVVQVVSADLSEVQGDNFYKLVTEKLSLPQPAYWDCHCYICNVYFGYNPASGNPKCGNNHCMSTVITDCFPCPYKPGICDGFCVMHYIEW